MSDRRRNALILLVVAGLIVASGAVIALKKTRLGLDLKGGVALVYQGKPTKQSAVNSDSLNRAIDIMRKRVDQLGVAEPEIQRVGSDQIDVQLPDVSNAQKAIAQVGKVAQLFFYDWETNVIGPNGQPAPTDPTVTGGQQAGLSGGIPQYDAVLRAALRPPQNAATATTGPGGTWYLVNDKTHSVVRGPEESQPNLFTPDRTRPIPPGSRAVHVNQGTILIRQQPPDKYKGPPLDAWYVLNDNPVLRGTDVKNPQQSLNNGTGGNGAPIVTFDFSSSGRKVFQQVTKQIAQRGQNAQLPGVSVDQARQHFAIALDNELVSAPYIDFKSNPDGIDASNGSQIEGGFTIDSAQALADELKTGALPIKLQLISQSQVSATLGKAALNQGLIAGLVGFALVCVFLMTFYRVLGLIAVAGLLIYAAYFFALIKLIPITMTLPGIAGLILTIGVAADANIVIFERIKEEIRAGRSVPAGIAAGYKRGFAAIVDANVVTFMTAFILFMLATAGVKGFAFTLGIGTLVSLFTAVLATQAALGGMGRSRLITHPSALGATKKRRQWRFDFMGASRWFFSLSGLILLIGALSIGGKGLHFGIDFKSGTRIKTAFVAGATETQIRDVLRNDGAADAQIQKINSADVKGNGFQISTRQLQPDKVQKIKADLDKRFSSSGNVQNPNGTRNFSAQSIGPTFGNTIANSAVVAIIASLLVISIYIALRFEWKYAVPVLIALMHDLLITAGVYSLTGREVTTSTVAALLTILGYSLYDTIIVFDRVRENVPRMPRAAFSQIVNRSMSEVLTRSLATTLCTLLPVTALLLFGGDTLKDFAFALLVGVASGAYSSIFIASPVLTHWKEREQVYRTRRQRIVGDLGAVPAYASGPSAASADIEAEQSTRRRRRLPGRLTQPEQPGEQLSPEEFNELVRDLDVEKVDGGGAGQEPVRTGAGRGGRGTPATPAAGAPAAPRRQRAPAAPPAPKAPAPAPEPEPEAPQPERDPTADLEPEDVVMPDQKRPPQAPRNKSRRNRRHGRSR